jgi:REP element-mobilizing transposase RayT
MGWPLRMFEPSAIYFVTMRCFQARLLLRPSSETNEVLGGVLARAARLSSVEVFSFTFASNHAHLLVRAPNGNLPRFMQYLRTNISKKVGRLVGWRGAFWERRYSAEPVLDDEALFGRVRYILSHGVKEHLVRRCAQWPGLTSLPLMLGAPRRKFKWFNWTRRWNARAGRANGSRFNERWAESEELELKPLPGWAHTPTSRRRRLLKRAVAAIEREAAAMKHRVLGISRILAQDPHHRPEDPARAPRPPCHTSDPRLRVEYLERYRAFVSAFVRAATNWRLGNFAAVFPPGAFRPALWPPAPGMAVAA